MLTKEKKTRQTTEDEKILKFFIRVFFNFRGCRLQTSLLFLLLRYENKNASATHLHDLLGIPDFEEWVSTASEQQNTFPRFVSFE